MKRLQCNFTTPEQSKRLLELGVPADSADCLLDNKWLKIDEDDVPSVIHKTHKFTDYDQQEYTPCWSVGRLLEIYVIVRGLDISYLPIERGEDMVKYLIRLYEEKAKDMDFSKLEE